MAQAVGLLLAAAVLSIWLWPYHPLPNGTTADAIVVVKSERTLSLLRNHEVISTYRVALGGDPMGHKIREGDGRTPEGRYVIAGRNRQSGFYRALRISYPNARDAQNAHRLGVHAGGDIMVHGIKNGFGWLGRLHRLVDWTDGCIAVTDEEMQDIWNATRDGTPIEILP